MERVIIQMTIKECEDKTIIAEAKVQGNVLEAMNALPMLEDALNKIKAAVIDRAIEIRKNNN